MASQTMLAGMKFPITGTPNSHEGTPQHLECKGHGYLGTKPALNIFIR